MTTKTVELPKLPKELTHPRFGYGIVLGYPVNEARVTKTDRVRVRFPATEWGKSDTERVFLISKLGGII